MAVWSNRILIVLGALGIFITGVLSYTTYYDLTPPCGGHIGCQLVQQSVYSKFPVGPDGVSVAYLGLFGYVALFALALLRSVASGRKHRLLSWVGFAVAGVGMLFSLYLTYASLAIIQQKCPWCLASLAVIILTTIVHAALLQGDTPERTDVPSSFGAGFIALAGALVSVFVVSRNLEEAFNPEVLLAMEKVKYEELVAEPAKIQGGADAKVTIVEFADMNCGLCRSTYPRIKETLAKYDGRVRLAFHHFPLVGSEGHETSAAGAAISEYAAERDMFWQFLDEVMKPSNAERIKTNDGMIAVAGEAGLSKADISTIFMGKDAENKKIAEKYWLRVDKDMNMGLKMLVSSTPTFILYAEGQPPKAIAPRDIDKVLGEEPYRSLIK